MDREKEKAALESVLRGRKEDFEAIVRGYQGQAYAVAMGLVKNSNDAMDLCQDAFLRSFRALRSFDTSQPFFPWFYRILRNVCLTHLKRRRTFSFLRRRNEEDEFEMDIPCEAAGPEDRAEQGEELQRLAKAFEALPPRDREILSLRHFQEMPYAEIAQSLEIPVGTVMSRLFYARRKLKERMEQA